MNPNPRRFNRESLFRVIEICCGTDPISRAYDVLMLGTIILSVLPLAFKEPQPVFVYLDQIAALIFIIDYILRLATADYKFKERGIRSFLRYPFTPLAIIDLLSILPSVIPLSNSFRLLRFLRLLRPIRVLRAFRYSRNLRIIADVLHHTKGGLATVYSLAVTYIVIAALVMFNVEPDTFDNFFQALYWSTVSLTTVGYGDICPVTDFGRLVAMLSSVFGIAIVALPTGIIAAEYKDSLARIQAEDERHSPEYAVHFPCHFVAVQEWEEEPAEDDRPEH